MLLHSAIAFRGSGTKEAHVLSEDFDIGIGDVFHTKIYPGYYRFSGIRSTNKLTGSCIINGTMYSVRIIYLDMDRHQQPIAFYLYDYATGRTRMFLVEIEAPFLSMNGMISQINGPPGIISKLIQYVNPMNEMQLFSIIPQMTREVFLDLLVKAVKCTTMAVSDIVQIIYGFNTQCLFELNYLIRQSFNSTVVPQINTEDGELSADDNRITYLYSIKEHDAILKLTEVPFKSFSVTIDFVNHNLDIHRASFIDDPNIVISGNLCLTLINELVRDFLLNYCNLEMRGNICYTVNDHLGNTFVPNTIVITKTADEIVNISISANETIFNRTYDTVAMILISPYTFSTQRI